MADKVNMRPFVLHILILSALSAPGVLLLIIETFSPHTGGPIFGRYDATKIYWLGLTGYTVLSSLILISVNIIFRIRETQFTKTAAILSHVIPVVIVLLMIQFGIHDLIQNLLENKGVIISEPSSETSRLTDPRRPKIPPTPPSKHMLYKSSGERVEPENQSLNLNSGQN